MPSLRNKAAGLALAALAFTGQAFAVTYYVDATSTAVTPDGLTWNTAFTTINAALGVVAPNDEIWVADGIYNESLTLPNDISLYGGFEGIGTFETSIANRDHYRNRAIIDATGTSNACVSGSSLQNILVDGFYMTGGETSNGGGVFLNSPQGAVTIRRCVMYQNFASNSGGGISIVGGGGVVVVDQCVIINNQGGGGNSADGVGIGLSGGSAAREIRRTYVIGNYDGDDGAGIFVTGVVNGLIVNCLIAQNNCTDLSGGLYLDKSTMQLINNTIADNTGGGGGNTAVYVTNNGAVTVLENNVFARNTIAGSFQIQDAGGSNNAGNTTIARNNLFYTLAGGAYADIKNPGAGTTFLIGNAMNAGDPTRFSGNIDGDPLFRQDDPLSDTTGTWDAVSFDPLTDTTTLTDNSQTLTPSDFQLTRFLDTDTSDYRGLSLVVDNTATSITVIGDLTAVAAVGDPFRIISYPPISGASPIVDQGLNQPLTVDIWGNPRPLLLTATPADTQGMDIGAYEVQDLNNPLLAVISSFTATENGAGSNVVLDWVTELEISNAGFHVLRQSGDGPLEQITTSLIPGQGDDFDGATYSFTDPLVLEADEYRLYYLKDIDFDGTETVHGPVFAGPAQVLRAAVEDWLAVE